MRACGGISKRAQLDQAEPAARPVGRVELVDAVLGAVRVARRVDQQVAQHAVDQPRRRRGRGARPVGQLREGELELVERVAARLVDARRLARRPDEEPREQIRERRVILPVADQAAQQIGPAQAAGCPRRSARPSVTWLPPPVPVWRAVEHELLGAQPRRARVVVEHRPCSRTSSRQLDAGGTLTSITPGSGVTSSFVEPRIGRRRVALEAHRQAQRAPRSPRRARTSAR